jgi:hypothetical protein
MSSIPRLGIHRFQPREKNTVTHGKSRCFRKPPIPTVGGSTNNCLIFIKYWLKLFNIKSILLLENSWIIAYIY